MSNFTDSTMNRGVEAKEIEIANARLDVEASNCTPSSGAAGEGREGRAGGEGGAAPSPDLSGSYLQVVVEKHKRKKEHPPAASAARLPVASSPAGDGGHAGHAGHAGHVGHAGHAGHAGDGGAWARGAVLLAYPAPHAVLAPAASLAYYVGADGGLETRGARGDGACAGGVASDAQLKKHKSWHLFREPQACLDVQDDDDADEGEVGGAGAGAGAEAECVEVYRFERVGSWLACGGARPTRVERRAARGVRAARALAAELGAAARLAAGAPLHAALLALRCALQLARDAAAGAVHAGSDYALKPALALAFNALLHPALVFLGNVLRGLRAALRPACGALGEAAAAAAVLVRAVRLVEVHYTPPHTCACRDTAHAPQPHAP